ncbi:MFS transporter [Sporosarcina sp. JAI121]|uniref:MFS transporter n=1 Tax=Sporosarcina sp. JAI121 TaxID=2723064 RepID=UPI0015C6C940|nr:MFS transporter [Sporosarcina sp. JAI121]NYF24334.1 DHA2 family multidrug resistance protein-like MFS transporter [Sporosarcina sp. JAI121]
MEVGKKGSNKMIIGIVLAVLTFWLFASSMVNIIPAIQADLGISLGTLNIAISITSLFSGMFIVAAGGISDRTGRKKLTFLGLHLSIIGSLCLVLAQSAPLLIVGRIIQGISAACIMPATIALVKSCFDGKERQRALSYWSFGSWGGASACALIGGAIATYMGWRWIFILSIVISLIAMYLLKDIAESKAEQPSNSKFDFAGLLIFIFIMLALNLTITRGHEFGWTSPLTIALISITIIGTVIFFLVEIKKKSKFIEFSLFKSKAYTGAVTSNFLQSAIGGTVVVANTYVQLARGFTAFQTGLLTIGNLVAVLIMIRVGEKIMQKVGARKPMIAASIITPLGISLTALTFLPDSAYIITVFLGFMLSGIGLGLYATPSMDTAVVNTPEDKVGVASGIYKMSSSLGFSFGIAISTAIYGVIVATGNMELAASAGIMVNIAFAIPSLIFIMLTIPDNEGKKITELSVVDGEDEKSLVLNSGT